ncbi:hypothetical protein L218DRAFT_1001668 [Marasmius fiardii PR-910]|nr:hypothetical protein L218DRAFT_1001668 [Marasmius fiardii PR-910]
MSESLEQLERDTDVFHKLVHSLIGIYVWEYFLSLDFDFAFITRSKPFRWPMIFYFANRYLLLCAMIGILVSTDSTSKHDCQLLYIFNQLAGNALTIANVNLCIRTVAAYGSSKPIIGLLVTLILGHWSVILLGIQLKAVWSNQQNACVIINPNAAIVTATFVYSTGFTFILFLLNVFKPFLSRRGGNVLGESRVMQFVFSDGLIYFFIAFLANLVTTVVMLVRVSPAMGVIFNIPAVIITTICATRALRRLDNFFEDKGVQAQVLTGVGVNSGIRFRRTQRRSEISAPSRPGNPATSLGGVHVRTETVTLSEAGHLQRLDERDADSDVETKAGSPI